MWVWHMGMAYSTNVVFPVSGDIYGHINKVLHNTSKGSCQKPCAKPDARDGAQRSHFSVSKLQHNNHERREGNRTQLTKLEVGDWGLTTGVFSPILRPSSAQANG